MIAEESPPDDPRPRRPKGRSRKKTLSESSPSWRGPYRRCRVRATPERRNPGPRALPFRAARHETGQVRVRADEPTVIPPLRRKEIKALEPMRLLGVHTGESRLRRIQRQPNPSSPRSRFAVTRGGNRLSRHRPPSRAGPRPAARPRLPRQGPHEARKEAAEHPVRRCDGDAKASRWQALPTTSDHTEPR